MVLLFFGSYIASFHRHLLPWMGAMFGWLDAAKTLASRLGTGKK